MSAVHYRYTDEQVAEDLNLYCALATEYVQNYTGTFHLLVAYRDRVGAGHGLTVPMVRATLNCMLHDAEVVNLPPPKYQARDYGSVTPITKARSFKDYTAPRKRRVQWLDDEDEEEYTPPPPPKPLRYLDVPLKLKHEYGMSTWPSSYVFHLVDPESHGVYDREENKITPKIWWRCKSGAYTMGKVPLVFMDSLEVAIHILQSGGALKACRRCSDDRELDKLRAADAAAEVADEEYQDAETTERRRQHGQQVLVDEAATVFMDGQVGTADMRPLRAWHPSPRRRLR